MPKVGIISSVAAKTYSATRAKKKVGTDTPNSDTTLRP